MDNLCHNIERNRSSGTIGRYPERCAADKCIAHAVDWADTTAWTAGGPATAPAFDIVIGADLVYHDDVIAMFISTLQHVLREGGRFLYVSRERRGGMALLGPALEMAGFTLQRREEAPVAYRRNPMPSTTQVCFGSSASAIEHAWSTEAFLHFLHFLFSIVFMANPVCSVKHGVSEHLLPSEHLCDSKYECMAAQDYCDTYFKNLTPASGQSFELFHYTYRLDTNVEGTAAAGAEANPKPINGGKPVEGVESLD